MGERMKEATTTSKIGTLSIFELYACRLPAPPIPKPHSSLYPNARDNFTPLVNTLGGGTLTPSASATRFDDIKSHTDVYGVHYGLICQSLSSQRGRVQSCHKFLFVHVFDAVSLYITACGFQKLVPKWKFTTEPLGGPRAVTLISKFQYSENSL